MRQEYGRSMIEMLGVLAIMGVITAASILLITQGMRMQKHSSTDETVYLIVTGVRNWMAQYDDFSRLAANDSEDILGALYLSNKNPYGGTYEVGVDPNNSRQFVVSINGLSQTECTYLMNKAWNDSVGYNRSSGKDSGASGNCNMPDGQNVVRITYGE